MVMAVDHVRGRSDVPKIIVDRDAMTTDFCRHRTQDRRVHERRMAALLQAERQISHHNFCAAATSQHAVGEENVQETRSRHAIYATGRTQVQAKQTAGPL